MQLAKTQHIFIYTLMLCALLFSAPLSTSAQTVNIPDANLRAAIAEALGKAPGIRITRDEMATLTHLEAHDADIRNLIGLEFATKLEEIRCNNNSIADLSPLAGLIKLRVVELRHNAIKDLSPVKELLNLDWLIVPYNLISDISPLKGLINLKGLDIGGNIISDFSPLAGLIKLERIWMGENPLGDISPLDGLISLRGIQTWGTPIRNLSALAKLPKLTNIDICGGEISDISPLANLTGLKELYLVGNEISDVSPLAGLSGLTRLNLSENQISDVSPLAGLTNLTWLGINHNQISNLSPLEKLSIPIVHHNTPAFPLGGPKIEGPWLWVLVPGDSVDNTDWLAQASNGASTEQKVATVGASEGTPVRNNEWFADNIAPVGHNNIGEMLKRQGVGNNGIVYGSVTLESPREQETRMFIAHRDGVKIWFNGELIHQKPDGHWGEGYHKFFPVILNAGTNVLLVALDNHHANEWKGFFGFDVDTEYTVNQPISRTASETPAYDVNKDGQISILDLILVGQDLGRTRPTNARTDVNKDGRRDISDLVLVARHLGEITGVPVAPSALAISSIGLDPAVIRTWIAQAQIENDGSLAFQQGIANLQRLLALSIPERTALLTNYPNPFNPETWIPYQLSEPAEVTLRIYAMSGVLVRTLNLGHQPAGIYYQRSRAAYWNGNNELGEPVASGIYFYTLTTGDFTATRKMLIMK
jgi:Leucine-rich repeat (LRR) protein